MMYTLREFAGWLVTLAGLAVFVLVYDLLLKRRVMEAGTLLFAGFVVFRGGVHILKVAIAARVARDSVKVPIPSSKRSPTERVGQVRSTTLSQK
jgi:hypothetical protein